MADALMDENRLDMTDRQRKARRSRNIAVALALAAFVVLIYLVSVAKLGPAILNRPL